MKSILEVGDLKGKKALVRVDWSVAISKGVVQDDFQIKESLPTLEYLQKAGAEVIIVTHLDSTDVSMAPVLSYVPEGMTILDNLRADPREKNNDEALAKELASRADIFVNEAFSVSHRAHASIVGIPKFLPSFAGFSFKKEIQALSKAFNPEHPFLIVIGGAKFETKLPLIKKFIDIADNIFVGGALAHSFYKTQGIDIKNSLVSEKEFELSEILKTGKIILPSDPIWNEDKIVDVGPESLENCKLKIESSRFIVWNGPLGNFEAGFGEGTKKLAQIIADSDAESIVGGGDTLTAIKELNLLDKFSFVSAGGGAMLEFLATGTLPGIEALR